MAGSSVVTSSDSSSVIGNPAGLGFMKDAEISATYAREELSGNDVTDYDEIQSDRDRGHALAAIPIVPTLDGTPRYGTLGLGWSGFKDDSDDDFETEGKGHGLHVSYGKDLSDNLAFGYGVSVIRKKVTVNNGAIAGASDMDDGVDHNVGLQYKPSKTTTVGFATHYGSGTYEDELTNLNTGAVEDGGDEDVDSWGAELGAGHQMGATLLSYSADYTNYHSDQDDDMYAWNFRAGVEQALTEWLKARLGYRYAAIFDYDQDFGNDNVKYNAVAFGAGVKLAKFLFADYGAEFRWVGDDSDWTHAVTLSVPFSLCVN